LIVIAFIVASKGSNYDQKLIMTYPLRLKLLLSLTAVLAFHLQLSIGRQISLTASGLLADKVKTPFGRARAPFKIAPAPTSMVEQLWCFGGADAILKSVW
jgi:hypothetical protein